MGEMGSWGADEILWSGYFSGHLSGYFSGHVSGYFLGFIALFQEAYHLKSFSILFDGILLAVAWQP